MQIQDLKTNATDFTTEYPRGKEILQKADGKTHYLKIAKDVGLNANLVSTILNKAKRYGLAEKKNGFFKRAKGVAGYLTVRKPRQSNKVSSEKVATYIISKQKNNAENKFKVSTTLNNNATKMMRAYKALYITENYLRDLIREAFKNETDLWEKRVNPTIKSNVEKAQKNSSYTAAERKDNLEYTHLGDLKTIIIAKNNWPLFLPYLNQTEKRKFEMKIDDAIPSRNATAHCTLLTDLDYKEVEIRFRDIIKMFK